MTTTAQCAFCHAPATCRERYGRKRRFCCDKHPPLDAVDLAGVPIDNVLARSSLGQGLARIHDEGIDAELAELEREMGTRRKR